jgi:lysophospholipase L1-like esterase
MRIVVFGDSIAAGFYDYEKSGWVSRLNASIMCPKPFVEVYNRSVSGDTTNEVSERVERDCKSIKPDIVIFQAGSNDVTYDPLAKKTRVSTKECRSNIFKLIKLGKQFTDKVIFTGLFWVDEKVANPWSEKEYYYNKDGKAYDQIIQEVCKKERICFIPMFDVLSSELLEDGVHPNAKGHQKIFEIVRDYLKKEKLI